MSIFITRGVLNPKLWALLDPSCQDTYCDALGSQIGQMVLELLTVDQNSNGQINEHKPNLI